MPMDAIAVTVKGTARRRRLSPDQPTLRMQNTEKLKSLTLMPSELPILKTWATSLDYSISNPSSKAKEVLYRTQ